MSDLQVRCLCCWNSLSSLCEVDQQCTRLTIHPLCFPVELLQCWTPLCAEDSFSPLVLSEYLLLLWTIDQICVPYLVLKDTRCKGGIFLLQGLTLASRYSRQSKYFEFIWERGGALELSVSTRSMFANLFFSYSTFQPHPFHADNIKIKSRLLKHRYLFAKSLKLLRRHQYRQKSLHFPSFSFKRSVYQRASWTFPERIIIFGKLASIQS